MTRFDEVYRRSLEQPEEFWAEAARAIDWDVPWTRVLDDSRRPFYRWFSGGRLNTCFNALDRHFEPWRADQLALIYDSPGTETTRLFTYRELRDEVARFAGALAAQGVGRGDRVIVYMPMVPEAVIAMLDPRYVDNPQGAERSIGRVLRPARRARRHTASIHRAGYSRKHNSAAHRRAARARKD